MSKVIFLLSLCLAHAVTVIPSQNEVSSLRTEGRGLLNTKERAEKASLGPLKSIEKRKKVLNKCRHTRPSTTTGRKMIEESLSTLDKQVLEDLARQISQIDIQESECDMGEYGNIFMEEYLHQSSDDEMVQEAGSQASAYTSKARGIVRTANGQAILTTVY